MGIYIVKNDELYHHGILGQRWGQRNGPPYPLGSSDHSASEKKAGWQKSLDKLSSKEDKLYSKKNKNQAKIDKLNAKLNTDKAKARDVRTERLKAKANVRTAQARRAGYKAQRGRFLLPSDRRQLDRARNAEAAYARSGIKNSKMRAKISELEFKNEKIDKKIEAIADKKFSQISRAEREFGRDSVFKALGIERTSESKKQFVQEELRKAKDSDQYLFSYLERTPDNFFTTKSESERLKSYKKWLEDGVNGKNESSNSYDSWLINQIIEKS